MQRRRDNFSNISRKDSSRLFSEHDNRWEACTSTSSHRYDRKYGGEWLRGKRRPFHGNQSTSDYRQLDKEGDFMMGGDGSDGFDRRFNPYSSRQSSWRKIDRRNINDSHRRQSLSVVGGGSMRRLGLPVSDNRTDRKLWFKVSIPHAKHVDKDTLLSSLNVRLPSPDFRPMQFQYEGSSAVFYIDNSDIANILKSISDTFTLPNCTTKLTVRVKTSSPPFPVMNAENVEKLKVVLSLRYDPSVRSLNLSSLFEDKSLQSDGLYLPLNRPVISSTVSKIINENIPELTTLDISNNRLTSASSALAILKDLQHITSLNLGRNAFWNVAALDIFSDLPLTELVLNGNPLCDRFTSKAEYSSRDGDGNAPVNKLLKIWTQHQACLYTLPLHGLTSFTQEMWIDSVIHEDGVELAPVIRFDVASSELPTSHGSYFANSEVQELVVKFLRQFYTIYDSDNRQPIIDAYHDAAVFSLSMAWNPAYDTKQPNLGLYIDHSRNHLRERGRDDHEKVKHRDRLLRKGKLQVVSELCSLPKTTHDAHSFVVDVNLLSSAVLSFVVNGLFKESENKADKPPVRSFSRCFIAVPSAGGVLIINDALTLSNATHQQMRSAFKSAGPTPSSSPVTSTTTTPLTPSVTGGSAGAVLPPQQQLELSSQRQRMVLAFSQQSGMNAVYSLRCLDENDWEYEKAGQVFLSLQTSSKIPAEAFVK